MSKSKSRDQVKKQESFKKTDVNGDITKIIFPHDIQVGLKNDDFAAEVCAFWGTWTEPLGLPKH